MKLKKIVAAIFIFMVCLSLTGCGVCETCNDEMKIICSNCNKGKIDCESCVDGLIDPVVCSKCNGKQYKLVDCSVCKGSGTVVNPITWEKFSCGACDGKLYEKDYCDKCNGEGRFGTDCDDCYSGTVTCDVCQGDYSQDCPDCKE